MFPRHFHIGESNTNGGYTIFLRISLKLRVVSPSIKRETTLPQYSEHSIGFQSDTGFIFKVLLLTFKALNNLAPDYLTLLLDTYKPQHQLRSSDSSLLTIPRTRLKMAGDRSLSHFAPTDVERLATLYQEHGNLC